jgi:hypothetical protein
MEPSLIQEIETAKKKVGQVLVNVDDLLLLTADEISRTTTFNEIHSRNAADAANQ